MFAGGIDESFYAKVFVIAIVSLMFVFAVPAASQAQGAAMAETWP